jgi:Fe-S-cluster-containing dehydrogenase component
MSSNRNPKYALVINSARCIDCKACTIACKVENNVPDGYWRNWIRHTGGASGRRTHFQPGQCMQCDNPSCVAACPVDATFKGKDGIVRIDATKCIGCGNCVTACPYGARFRNPVSRVADKCDFCRHRLAVGEEPACVQTCPTRARAFGDLNDPESTVSKMVRKEKLVQVPAPHIDTRPNLYYFVGTPLLDWAREPSLPGHVHMSLNFWKE